MFTPKLHLSVSLFTVLLFSFTFCNAQQAVTEFGDFTAGEINLKQCEFDKDADAVVLLDKANSYYNDNYNLITERRIRIKILKEKGIKRGDIHIRYYSDEGFESISGIDAAVLNFNDYQNKVWSKLDRKFIYTKKLNKYYSEISFALPDVKQGSLIEYKYESQMKHYGGLREWVFQKDIPVILSSYNLTVVPNSEFAYSVYKSKDMPILVKPNSGSGNILFEMNNIPGLREEAFMGAARDYLQRVNFQFAGYNHVEGSGYTMTRTSTTKYSTTWKDLAQEMLSGAGFGSQINKSLSGADILQQTWMKETDEFIRMKTIHDYVKSHLSWNNIYSKYAEDGIKEPWEKKTGTSGEINLILINLLKASGLQVKPLLVSERDNGKVDTAYPYINQFDKVVAYVTINDKHYILDGTDRQTPALLIPFNLLNTIGFIVDKKNASLLKIADDTKKNSTTIYVSANITDAGLAEAEASVKNYDYAKIDKKEEYNNNKKKYEKDFFEPFTITALDSFNVTGAETDSLPLEHEVKISYQLNKAGDYFLLNCNLFTGLNKNPFITPQRFSDINFGCKYSYVLNEYFKLPQNLSAETLPKTLRLVTPDKSMAMIRQVSRIDDSTIYAGVKIDFSKTEYSADDYFAVQGFYKQMIELLNEPVVLKEKP